MWLKGYRVTGGNLHLLCVLGTRLLLQLMKVNQWLGRPGLRRLFTCSSDLSKLQSMPVALLNPQLNFSASDDMWILDFMAPLL